MYRSPERIKELILQLWDKSSNMLTNWPEHAHEYMRACKDILDAMEVQEDDEATGLEILISYGEKVFFEDCPHDYGLKDDEEVHKGWGDERCKGCWSSAVNKRYIRKSGTWVPVGEK
jgi:hypothetical protein